MRALGHALYARLEWRVRTIVVCCGLVTVTIRQELGADRPGLDQDHADAERRDLQSERITERLQRVLVHLYGQPVGGVTRPAADPKLTMTPLRRARIPGKTSWHMRIRPKTLVSKVSRMSSSDTSSTGPPPPCPALLTRTPLFHVRPLQP